MIKNIVVERFKKIKKAELNDLANINVLIGSNNSGKSSILQAIQFAVSSAQSIVFSGKSWTKMGRVLTTSLSPEEFLYTPIGDIKYLYHERPIKGSRKSKTGAKVQDSMVVLFTTLNKELEPISANVSIYKGQIKNLSVRVDGRELGQQITDLDSPFSIYVPGLSGIPNNESYSTPLTIRKVATKGDANNVLRNILYQLKVTKSESWAKFIFDLQNIFPEISIETSFREAKDEFIKVDIVQGDSRIPLDCLGTGVLQAIQIFSYIHYFEPRMLLLDEPDAHVHPTNQKKIIRKLSQVADEKGIKVILTTHSSHVLSAIDAKAKLLWAHDGMVEAVEDSYKILMDIGALESEYLFANQHISTFILTEDEVDDVKANKEYLKTIAVANGFDPDKTILFSYHGCSNLYTAKILKEFIRKHIPGAEVVIHRDKDFYDDNDLKEDIAKAQHKGIDLFFTKGNDIESYFIQLDHLIELFPDNSPEELQTILDSCIAQARQDSLEKIQDFLMNKKREKFLRDDGYEISLSKLKDGAIALLDKNKYLNSYSKKVKGLVVNELAKLKGGQINVTKVTKALEIPELKSIMKRISEKGKDK